MKLGKLRKDLAISRITGIAAVPLLIAGAVGMIASGIVRRAYSDAREIFDVDYRVERAIERAFGEYALKFSRNEASSASEYRQVLQRARKHYEAKRDFSKANECTLRINNILEH